MTIKIYSHPVSGHAHRARLFASLIGAEAKIVDINLAEGEHKSPEFLKKNRFGQIPVLEDGDTVIADSNAILVYLARKLNKTDWLPEDAQGAAAIQRWLSVAAGPVAFGLCAARLINLFDADFNPEEVKERGYSVLKVMDQELDKNKFIVGGRPTIADVALYSYVASAPEGDIDLSPYANVSRWLVDMESLPGFVPFDQNKLGLRKTA